MVHTHGSTLPHVLVKYHPQYGQKSEKTGDARSSIHGNSPERSRSRKMKERDRHQSPPAPPSRETTVEIKKRQAKEHNERMFENWQRVKEEVRENETDRLKEKIQLQHDLIRTRDLRDQQRKSERIQRYVQQREREKAEREARNNALQQICRESLEDDKRQAKEKHVSGQREKLRLQNEQHAFPVGLLGAPAPAGSLGLPTPTLADSEMNQGDANIVPTEEDNQPSGSSITARGVTIDGTNDDGGFEPVMEEEEEEVREEEEELPWHHVQLYELYGKDADYFLHPKITTEKKADIVLNPRLRTIGGRAGAGVLWDVLRNESRMKLIREDSKLLSPELKSAFGAFAREGLANKKTPLVRNFNSGDDVPDMEKLMDQSRIHNAQDFRHKVELMFRSSTINQNRTKVLLYNNPPPDVNNMEGGEGVQRYMPSWVNDKWDEESELSYKKWLSNHDDQLSLDYLHDDVTSQGSTRGGGQGDRMPRTPRTPHTPCTQALKARAPDTKYVFLTEEEATTPGRFTQRHREQEEAKGRPTQHAHHDLSLIKSQSAMASLGGTDRRQSDTSNDTPRGVKHRAQSEMSSQFISQWEPLSLNALMEYKQSQDALGHGEFSHGKSAIWSNSQAAVSTT